MADLSAWLRILDPDSGEIFFDCAHCGTGDYGWDWFASSGVNAFHASTDDELFRAASWVMHDHPSADVIGLMGEDFLEWWGEDDED